MSLSIGIIGAGFRLRHLTRLLLATGTGVHIAGIYDPSDQAFQQSQAELGCDCVRYPSVNDLLADDQISWVLIGSWNRFHREQIVAALRAGKQVFTEKPLAINIDDCVAIQEAEVQSRSTVTVGFTLRYSPHYGKIRELVQRGAVGRIVSLEFNELLDFNHGGFIHADWRRHREDAGTHLLEKCCHDIDLVNWISESRADRVASFGGLNFFRPENFNRIAEVGNDDNGKRAYMTWRSTTGLDPFTSDKDIVDNQVAIMEFANGIRATFHTNCNAAIPERKLSILGTHGAIESDVVSGRIHYHPISFRAPIEDVSTGVAGSHGDGDTYLINHLARLMKGEAENLSTVTDGVASAVTCFGIDDAMDGGRVVDMKPYWNRVDQAGNA